MALAVVHSKVVILLLVYCLLYGSSVIRPCFVIRLVSSLVFNQLAGQKRTGCLLDNGIVLSFGCLGSVSLPRGMVYWYEERLKILFFLLAWTHLFMQNVWLMTDYSSLK